MLNILSIPIQIWKGEITPKQLCRMTSIELYPYKSKHIMEKIDIQNNQKIEQGEYSKLYVCKKCNESTTRVIPKQLRRGDEQMNYIITCTNCGNSWVI